MAHIVFLGNFEVPYSSENHHANSLESLGHTVCRLQERFIKDSVILENALNADLFVLKSDNDALRFIESLTERFVKLKRGDCMFVNDSSAPQKKYLYKLLEEKGFNKDFLYRKETTYSSAGIFM